MKPTLLRIIVNPTAGHEEEVRQALLTRLNAYQSNGVQPVMLRWIRSSFDLEILVAVFDFTDVDDFLIDVVRTTEHVMSTITTVMLDGFIFLGGFVMAENARLNNTAHAGATIEISVTPGKDKEVFAALYDLPEADDLHKAMLFKSYTHEHNDLVLQLSSTHNELIENYIQVFVRPIDGIEDTYSSFTYGWAMLMDFETFNELQGQFSP